MIAEIIRLDTSIKYGTFGVLKLDKQLFCYTLENPWLMNKPNISCIPSGQYECERHYSPKFGATFIVNGVVDRSHILFHKMNVHTETQGCIGLGMYLGELNGVKAILNSSDAFHDFMDYANGRDKFRLIITENY